MDPVTPAASAMPTAAATTTPCVGRLVTFCPPPLRSRGGLRAPPPGLPSPARALSEQTGRDMSTIGAARRSESLGMEATDAEGDPLRLLPVGVALTRRRLQSSDRFVGVDTRVGEVEGLAAQPLVVRARLGDGADV